MAQGDEDCTFPDKKETRTSHDTPQHELQSMILKLKKLQEEKETLQEEAWWLSKEEEFCIGLYLHHLQEGQKLETENAQLKCGTLILRQDIEDLRFRVAVLEDAYWPTVKADIMNLVDKTDRRIERGKGLLIENAGCKMPVGEVGGNA